jgi:uroporphyrinogen-III decarboxylase
MIAWRKAAGFPVPQKDFGFADDSVALISTPMYREHVLPHHRRLCDALAGPSKSPRSIHLCGDSTRHFETLVEELNVKTFDTGFPVDFGAMRRELGPEVRLQGGPHVDFLMRATPGEVRDEVRRIFKSGVLEGGRFLLREGNNLAPHTPLANTESMYHAGLESACVLSGTQPLFVSI